MNNYPTGFVLDSIRNYGIVKTEAVFGFDLRNENNFLNSSSRDNRSVEWIFSHSPFEGRSLQGTDDIPIKPLRSQKISEVRKNKEGKKRTHHKFKKKHNHMGKLKRCLFNVFKKVKKNKRKLFGIKSKYVHPLILGLLAVKILLISLALKILTFISTKGLMMGFFSTALVSALSLRGMFDHSQVYSNRKEDTKTQVEIIQVPPNNEDSYIYDKYYKR